MSDTNLSASTPAVILVVPQLGENIGAAARAMANFGLSDLRLVRPRDGWPNPDAVPMAAGATHVLEAAKVFRSTQEAVADLSYVLATTARPRGMVKPVLDGRQAGDALRQKAAAGLATGLLFGGERSGLENDDVVLADAILTLPVAPDHRSINLAQAVLLAGYEWFAGGLSPEAEVFTDRTRPATKEELTGFFNHLEQELDNRGFFTPPEKRPAMVRNLRNLWGRADLREQDIRTLRGIVASLSRPAKTPDSGEK